MWDTQGLDPAAALAEAQRQTALVEEIQRDIDSTDTVGQSAHGMVRVTVRGTGLVVDVTIDPEAVRYYDAETLGGLVLEAINDGMRTAVTSARDKFAVVLSDLSLFDELLARWPQPGAPQRSRTTGGDDRDWDGW